MLSYGTQYTEVINPAPVYIYQPKALNNMTHYKDKWVRVNEFL